MFNPLGFYACINLRYTDPTGFWFWCLRIIIIFIVIQRFLISSGSAVCPGPTTDYDAEREIRVARSGSLLNALNPVVYLSYLRTTREARLLSLCPSPPPARPPSAAALCLLWYFSSAFSSSSSLLLLLFLHRLRFLVVLFVPSSRVTEIEFLRPRTLAFYELKFSFLLFLFLLSSVSYSFLNPSGPVRFISYSFLN